MRIKKPSMTCASPQDDLAQLIGDVKRLPGILALSNR
jgi:hypothetical protein